MSQTRSNHQKRRSGLRRSSIRKWADVFLALAVLGVLAILTARIPPASSPEISLQGPARVTDGDSLVVNGVRIRLYGIDAPELAQTCINGGADYPCGRQAAAELRQLVAGRQVICQSQGNDRYGRVLARCTAAATELNRAMVEAGWAVAYGDYTMQERAARQAGRGLWRGEFEQPQDWRRRSHADRPEIRQDWFGQDWFADFWGWLSDIFGS